MEDTFQTPIIAIQGWLLGQGRCVSCGKNLYKAKKERKNGTYLITCKCKRVYVWEIKANFIRRAHLQDLY